MTRIQDIEIDQGSMRTLKWLVRVLTEPTLPEDPSANPRIPLDLAGYSVRMQVRRNYDSSHVFLEFSSTGSPSKFTLGGVTGVVTLSLDGTEVEADAFDGESWNGVHDIELTDGSGQTIRVVKGKFTVWREVTRSP